MINGCPKSTENEKHDMKAELFAAKVRDGPTRGTRAKKAATGKDGTTGRLTNGSNVDPLAEQTSCTVTVSDNHAYMQFRGRCDDGSYSSIASPKIVEAAALKGIGNISAIVIVRLTVALKAGEEAQTFLFSRSCLAPRTILHLASEKLALVNITFLVADDDLPCEDLLIGLPVLQHLKIDTRTLLENNRAELGGADCTLGMDPLVNMTGGYVSRLMVARLNHLPNREHLHLPDPLRPRANYYRIGRKTTRFLTLPY